MLQCLLYYFGRLNKVPMIKFVIAEVIDYMVEFAFIEQLSRHD